MRTAHPDPPARRRILAEAARRLRDQGYSGTSVDEICEGAGVTKGNFFYYFKTKEALGVAVLDGYQQEVVAQCDALRRGGRTPLEHFWAVLDYLGEAAERGPLRRGCILGTVAQDVSHVHPGLRDRCARHFDGWIELLAADLVEVTGDERRAREIAECVVAMFQGASTMAKATGDPSLVRRALRAARRLLEPQLTEGATGFTARRARRRGR